MNRELLMTSADGLLHLVYLSITVYSDTLSAYFIFLLCPTINSRQQDIEQPRA